MIERNHQTQYTNHKSQIATRKAQIAKRNTQIANHKTSRNHQKTPLSNKHTASGVLGRGKKGHSARGRTYGRRIETLCFDRSVCFWRLVVVLLSKPFFTFRIPKFRSNNHHICIYSPSSLWLLTERGDTNFARWFEFGHLAFFLMKSWQINWPCCTVSYQHAYQKISRYFPWSSHAYLSFILSQRKPHPRVSCLRYVAKKQTCKGPALCNS